MEDTAAEDEIREARERYVDRALEDMERIARAYAWPSGRAKGRPGTMDAWCEGDGRSYPGSETFMKIFRNSPPCHLISQAKSCERNWPPAQKR